MKTSATSPTILSRSLAGFLGALLILSDLPARAQGKLIEIQQCSMQPPVQTGRPMPSWWDVNIQGSALVEGRIEFRIKNDNRLLATVTTEDLAMAGPQQRIRVLLPPVIDQASIDQVQVDARFLGTRFNQDLGSHILRVALSRSRTFMVLTSASRLAPRRSPQRDAIIRRLAFESLVAGLEEAVKTVHTPLEPADLPQEPMAYCAYEMAIVFGEEFRLLKKQQLDALAAWIRAGGSLYLEPTDVLEPYHVEFLRNLVASGPEGLVVQPDSQGRLVPGTLFNDERLIPLTSGLGRIVLRVDDNPSETVVDTPAWRDAAAFLWRWHADQVKLIGHQPSIGLNALLPNSAPPIVAPSGFPSMPSNAVSGYRLTLKLPSPTFELMDWLMPEGVRMVPLWVLALILTTFVLWIGPVEYFGLARLNARKFTWLTFPLATFLVTGLTVWITNRYMSSAEARRGLIIRDLGDDGAVVRTNRFELLFIASSRPVTTSVRKGLFSTMLTGNSIADPQTQYQQQMAFQRGSRGRGEAIDRPPPRLSGRIPTEFTATQELAKWTPQLNRLFWIPGPAEESPIDWRELMEGISLDEMFSTHSIPGALQARVRKHFGSPALVACLGHRGRWSLNREANWELNEAPSDSRIRYDVTAVGHLLPGDVQQQPLLFQWLYQNSIGTPYGLFSLTSQVGPTGGAELDDLPILDASDPGRALLIVVVPRGDDFVVFRKLVRTGT